MIWHWSHISVGTVLQNSTCPHQVRKLTWCVNLVLELHISRGKGLGMLITLTEDPACGFGGGGGLWNHREVCYDDDTTGRWAIVEPYKSLL